MAKDTPTQTAAPEAVTVRIVEDLGLSVVVEWWEEGRLCRSTVPASKVSDGTIDKETLSLGVPYGLAWKTVLILQATVEALEEELHRVGIWTAEDLLNNQQAAFGALQAVYGLDLAQLVRAAAQAKKGR